MNEARVLALSLHGRLVGYLVGARDGRNILAFDAGFRDDPLRPTLSLITSPVFPNSQPLLSTPWVTRQRLHPVLSNLLPEGALRAFIAQSLKIHENNEFEMMAYLGADLPGALVAEPADPDDLPPGLKAALGKVAPLTLVPGKGEKKFSLAGVQMKFSMKERDGRFNVAVGDELGDWIIKTPSTAHRRVPENEYSAMTLAAMVGVEIPDIRLVSLDKLDNLPDINLPDEELAFAIRRFDRDGAERIHMEDFAQVLVKYAHEKYRSANYEQIGRILYQYSGQALTDVQQLARRLLSNALLANGDAHLKNWSLLYQDRRTPILAPAYDIVTTRAYIANESEFALNLGKTKSWYELTLVHFQAWALKAGVPWRAIRPVLLEVMEKARTLWPAALDELPMDEGHKKTLRAHWRALHDDFRL
ncbi:type II toxin-antitoxin system HipA family toxin [Alloalcanivorax marinus]|uniref:type II toxin-antitoxin system HipA family toxin n=1 Tax=Alloalcanivorax marinus TaxID=1177169 RepID=UPI0019315E59|nr:type II toxin-antitoxin system HipA family toxin [Alloalcanivorax marinus]MBL7251241.1 type II toxin-antitoxin system HipA family toxin [Alloalcanivorax marinus]